MTEEKCALKAFQDDLEVLLPFFELERNCPDLELFVDTFGDILSQEAEFSFAPFKKQLELTIQGRGQPYHAHIEKLLRSWQISDEHIEAYRRVNEFFPDTGTLLKVDFQKNEEPCISIYYQSQMSIRLCSRIARILRGVALPGEVLLSIGNQLGRKGVYAGFDFRRKVVPALSLFYLLSPQKAKNISSFVQVMKSLAMSENQQALLEKYHGDLTAFISGDLFVSFPLQENSLHVMKIDYELVSLPLALKVIMEAGIPEEEVHRFLKIAKALDTSLLSYFGIKYHQRGDILFKFYFKRVYFSSESEEMEKIANFLESSIWRF